MRIHKDLCRHCRNHYDPPPEEKPYFNPNTDWEFCPYVKGYDRTLHGGQGVQGPYYRDIAQLGGRVPECCPYLNKPKPELVAIILSEGKHLGL